MDFAEYLKSHLECPICLNVPRSGVMLQCLNGHNVCAVCLRKIKNLTEDAKCPQGRCSFNAPPTKNFLAANLIGSYPFEWPCKYQENVGCTFEGTSTALASHEDACKWQRTFKCSRSKCGEKVSFGTVVKHLGTTHKVTKFVSVSEPNQGLSIMLDDGSISRSEDVYWTQFPLRKPDQDGEEWLLCFHKGHFFVWMHWNGLSVDGTEKFVSRITVREAGDNADDRSIVLITPMYNGSLDRRKGLQGGNRSDFADFLARITKVTKHNREECRFREDSEFSIMIEMIPTEE